MPLNYFDIVGVVVGFIIGGWTALMILKHKKKKDGKRARLEFIKEYGEDFEEEIINRQQVHKKAVFPSLEQNPSPADIPSKKKKVVKRTKKKKVKKK